MICMGDGYCKLHGCYAFYDTNESNCPSCAKNLPPTISYWKRKWIRIKRFWSQYFGRKITLPLMRQFDPKLISNTLLEVKPMKLPINWKKIYSINDEIRYERKS